MKSLADLKIREIEDFILSDLSQVRHMKDGIKFDETIVGGEIKTLKIDYHDYSLSENDDYDQMRVGVEVAGYIVGTPEEKRFYYTFWWDVELEEFTMYHQMTKEEFDNFDQEIN